MSPDGPDRGGTDPATGVDSDRGPDPKPDTDTTASAPDRLRDRLREEGMRVTAAGEVDGTLEVVYETAAPIVPPGQVGRVLSALGEFEEYEPCEIGATVVDPDGRTVGVWSVRGEWLRALRNGEVAEEEELAQRAVDGIHNY